MKIPMTNSTVWRTGDLRLLINRIYETVYGDRRHSRMPSLVTVKPTKPGRYETFLKCSWHNPDIRRLQVKVPDVDLDVTAFALNVAQVIDTEVTDPEADLRGRLAFIRRFEWTKTFEVRRRIRQ